MNVGFGIWDLTIQGGTQRQLLELARRCRGHGHRVRIYACHLNRERCYPALLRDLDVVALHEGVRHVETAASHPNPVNRLAYYLRRYAELGRESVRLAARVTPDTEVFNAHDHNAGRIGASVKRRLGIPAVWMVNDLPRSFLPRSHPWVSVLGRAALAWNVNALERAVARRYDRLVVLDERNRRLVRAAVGAEAVIVRSGLDVAGIAFSPKAPRPAGAPIQALCVGAWFPWRRYEDAVRAVAILRAEGRAVRLRILGNRRRAAAYATRVEHLGERLAVADLLTVEDEVVEETLREAFAAAEVFLFTASPQTWGLSVFEAMAAGTPAVVSRGAGAHEVLTDGLNALLVSPGRPNEIAGAIRRLADDPELAASLATEGRRFVESRLSWERYAADMEAIFASCLGPAARPGAPDPGGPIR